MGDRKTTSSRSGASAEQVRMQERESDAAFVERSIREHDEYLDVNPMAHEPEYRRLLGIASRAVTPQPAPGSDQGGVVHPSTFLRRGPRETRLEFARRCEVVLAGWQNDDLTRDRLGSNEQAAWWIGRCAAEPSLVHPYGPISKGVQSNGAFAEDIEAVRAAMARRVPQSAAEMRERCVTALVALREAIRKRCSTMNVGWQEYNQQVVGVDKAIDRLRALPLADAAPGAAEIEKEYVPVFVDHPEDGFTELVLMDTVIAWDPPDQNGVEIGYAVDDDGTRFSTRVGVRWPAPHPTDAKEGLE